MRHEISLTDSQIETLFNNIARYGDHQATGTTQSNLFIDAKGVITQLTEDHLPLVAVIDNAQ